MGEFQQRILTKEQELEVCELYYEQEMMQIDIAKKYGVSSSTICRIVNRIEYMTEFLKKTTASKVRAQCRINRALDEAVDTQLGLMRGKYEDQYKYLSQNAARDILDRGGVRAEKEDKAEVRITMDFGEKGSFDLGVPDHSMDNMESE
ncbi:MAG: hypothetical protein IJ418_19780 [Clostridia bacterium]|nr:hypothetical protein [Clostridia bacterium]